ncbi:FCD domain-containing protein [Vibrio sp. PP-XX7]
MSSPRFHIELAKISGNQVMAEFVQQLAFRSSLVVAVYGSKRSVGCDCGCHHELLHLIEQGAVAQSIQWMTQHLQAIKYSLNFHDTSPLETDFSQIFTPLN